MMTLLNSPVIRSFVWRLGRRLYHWARREASGSFERNGERWLMRKVLFAADRGGTSVLLDIGAHKGNWSDAATSLLKVRNIPGCVYAFEPSSSTFSYLTEKYKGCNLISMNRIALSDCSGEREFYVVGELAGTNSLLRIDGANIEHVIEHVRTLRVDDFLGMHRIDHALFVKSDAEGNDFAVLRGAAETLQKGLIDVWQFEYNRRWIAGRYFLKDVFDFIADKPYLLGKLYGDGIEIYDTWHPELERYFESNYVLIRKGSCYEELCSRVRFDNHNVLMPG
jgi:FkbM family methyltransferase